VPSETASLRSPRARLSSLRLSYTAARSAGSTPRALARRARAWHVRGGGWSGLWGLLKRLFT
jgi:hypothetical protein